ncbi:hypothetical protein PS1_038215 [Malus domestica]
MHQKNGLVIDLAFLGADKHALGKNWMSSHENKKGLKNSREQSLSPLPDNELSIGSYHGSLTDDQISEFPMIPSVSMGGSDSMAMQCMLTGVISVEE